MGNTTNSFKGLWRSLKVLSLMLWAGTAFAQIQVAIPHDWTDDDHYVRSPDANHQAYNIGAAYDNFHLNVSYQWMFPEAQNYSLYALKDAAGGFLGLGGRKWINLSSLPTNNNYATFCSQQNIPVPGLPGVTVPGVVRQAWELRVSPFGPQNLSLSVTCSGPITSTLPWYVFLFNGSNPLTANVVGVFRS